METSTTGDFKIVEEPSKPLAMEPRKFGMWLFMGSVFMLFAALTSAYIVREAEGNWVYFEMPRLFTISTVVILVSSITMQWAYWSAKKDNLSNVKVMMTITTVLGFAFLVLQWLGWVQLVAEKIYFVGNPSGSFLYVLTGVHALHIISAIVFLLIVLVATYRYKVHSKSMVSIEMCTTYWHFLGGLWLYLFVFLLLYR
ncbi:MAG TPA: cytochrome c oxidase subunit 3 [Cyclobacteriaceae bacterium]|jgi:cytochrome c oxidase subunit 3|nr:cytochrome c oxidase subunit 3 [Cytophagales bacterium]HMR58838.1 cytochrome c oxidase subunit 3 [Cyclobacteriaceae bacterium]HRE66199.1 cytochrome c oxidase subunit 3 [Cyclobacteriaceae bacterium]HRF32110.1 cytochrome c oxidase subunit 3 [Cyclobacteriaceae bacterium]